MMTRRLRLCTQIIEIPTCGLGEYAGLFCLTARSSIHLISTPALIMKYLPQWFAALSEEHKFVVVWHLAWTHQIAIIRKELFE
jgi:uncharacterized membrane protein YagU involved in acid resistance